jgi:hypothetical protein
MVFSTDNDFEIHKPVNFHTEHISHGNRKLQQQPQRACKC